MTEERLILPARLDLAAATPLAVALEERAGHDLTLDAGEVGHIGAMGLQLLRAAAQSWAAAGHRLELVNLTAEAADQLALLGFTGESVTRWEGGR